MAEVWTRQRVVDLAPDARSVSAGEQQARSPKWDVLARSERALWGEVRGSGKRPYMVAIDLAEPAFKCSCPSRKFPCKHGIGLFLIFAESPERLAESEPADWVAEWLSGRDDRQERKEKKAAEGAKPPDPVAREKRIAKRGASIARGIGELEVFVLDVVRQGLIEARNRPLGDWTRMAERMIDAQAPGLARQLHAMGAALTSGEGWEARFARLLGRLQLAIRAHGQGDALPDPVREDLRTFLGWTRKEAELETAPESGTWVVMGQSINEDDRLLAQRTWLRRSEDGRPALVLSFAAGQQPLDHSLVVGTAIDADLQFFPGALPLRALVRTRRGEARPAPLVIADEADLGAALDGHAVALGANPFLERWPFELRGMRPWHHEVHGWCLLGPEGEFVVTELPEEPHWEFLSLSGGRPLDVFGEWNGDTFRPLTAMQDGALFTIGRDARTPDVVCVS